MGLVGASQGDVQMMMKPESKAAPPRIIGAWDPGVDVGPGKTGRPWWNLVKFGEVVIFSCPGNRNLSERYLEGLWRFGVVGPGFCRVGVQSLVGCSSHSSGWPWLLPILPSANLGRGSIGQSTRPPSKFKSLFHGFPLKSTKKQLLVFPLFI